MSAYDDLAHRAARFGSGDGEPVELDAAELCTEITEVHLAEPGDYVVIHPDGSAELRRPQL